MPCRRALRVVPLALAAFAPSGAGAQRYPVAPSPVLEIREMERGPTFGGYVAVRLVRRHDSTAFEMARARASVQMRPLPFLAIRVQGELANRARDSSAAAFALTDAYVLLSPVDSSARTRILRPALIVGQFRTPFSMEYLTPFSQLRTPERSHPVDSLSTRRDIGVLAQVSAGRLLRLTGALVNGSGANVSRNPDDRVLAVGRLTLVPLEDLALAAKWEGEGSDHRWGGDARWLPGNAIVEGEVLWRRRTIGAGRDRYSGGYALAAYKVLPWLQPVVKWERFEHSLTTETSATWTTLGTNVMTPQDNLRLQLAHTVTHAHPSNGRSTLFIAQLIAIF